MVLLVAVRLLVPFVTVAVLLAASPAAAQMISPLAGQGEPPNSTTDIFISVYLDRLLAGACMGWPRHAAGSHAPLPARRLCLPTRTL